MHSEAGRSIILRVRSNNGGVGKEDGEVQVPAFVPPSAVLELRYVYIRIT